MTHRALQEIDIELNSGWQFRATEDTRGTAENFVATHGWHAASVPGTVYQDLIASASIPDPYYGRDEEKVQWVADQDWCYRTEFELSLSTLLACTDLVFDGLDTFARVWLNGTLILEHDNMFVAARVPVNSLLRDGKNCLEIYFASALRRGREREAAFGKRHLWNGDSSRLYVRKAQYHYGWDWGPVLLTAGPWKPIRLHSYAIRIEEIDTPIWLNAELTQAHVDIRTHVAGNLSALSSCTLEHVLYDPKGVQLKVITAPLGEYTESSIGIEHPQLWWPAGHGAQALYRLHTRILSGDTILAQAQRRLGIRRMQLVQEPVKGEKGRSFYFAVNGKAIYAGGADWIPDDNLLNRITPQRYRDRVQQAVAANMLMLRVWGGGIYEDEAFYDACDELGVLVWQDFLFACGMYPAHPEFLASVKAEATAAVLRLRHRASLAIWCGNNEDYALAESIGQHGKNTASFDARAIYEKLLPEICNALDPLRPYWPGSPYSPSATEILPSDDQTIGDRHSWEVWHREMLPYQQYHKVQARFVSEFGMQAHPSLALLTRSIPDAEQFPLSRTMAAHNKAGSAEFADGHRRLAVYVADTLSTGPDLVDTIYATQFVQAEAMRYAYQDFRRRWQETGARAVGGALVWQLNDCWPATSWAIIDSAGTVKPAWHSIRRALASISVAIRLESNRANIWVMNDRDESIPIQLVVDIFTIRGELLRSLTEECIAKANASTEFELPITECNSPCVARVRVLNASHELARDVAWPEPYRFHRFSTQALSVQRNETQSTLSLKASAPVKGIWLEGEGLGFSDNFIDLLPDEALTIKVTGQLRDKRIFVSALEHPRTEI